MYDEVIKRRLKDIQSTFMKPDPDERDSELWKMLWENGIDIEATWSNMNKWMQVSPKDDGGIGIAFKHKKNEVKFRRRIK